MSYGSTFVQFDPNGKLSSRLSRAHARRSEPERPHKLLAPQFDVSLSRVGDSGPDRTSVRDSMLAYSNKMRSLQEARHNAPNTQNDPLFVRAKHIPKHPTRAPKKRRPMSFDELLGRDREASDRRGKAKQRPHSDKHKPKADHSKTENELRLPMLTERLRSSGTSVQVSLVSASDLYELVDFSLKSKNSRAENLQLLEAEAAGLSPRRRSTSRFVEESTAAVSEAYDRYERVPDLTRPRPRAKQTEEQTDDQVPSHSFYEQVFSMDKNKSVVVPVEPEKQNQKLPSLNNDLFRRRPNRVKRMKLQDPALSDIPEDEVIDTGEITKNSQIEIARRVVSPPPHRRSPKSSEFMNKSPLDAIMEQSERSNGRTDTSLSSDSERTSTAAVTGGVRDEGSASVYRGPVPATAEDAKTTKKMLIRDDGDVRIEVTQCPPKQEFSAKLKAQKRFSKKLIYLRDGAR